jgi:hypothetical protein
MSNKQVNNIKKGHKRIGSNSNLEPVKVENNIDDMKQLQQKVDCVGKVPTARFGHTIVLVSQVKVVLFGGAVGDTKNFQFTGDTYVLNLMTKIWVKLESKV